MSLDQTSDLSDVEVKILTSMNDVGDDYCLNLKGIAQRTGYDRELVRGACRSLKRKCLARFSRGLFDPDLGMTAGSGYGITQTGMRWLKAYAPLNLTPLTVDEAWTELCETPDITSPEEYPDHALITIEQLGNFMARASARGGEA